MDRKHSNNVTTFDILLLMLSYMFVNWALPESSTGIQLGVTYILWRSVGAFGLVLALSILHWTKNRPGKWMR